MPAFDDIKFLEFCGGRVNCTGWGNNSMDEIQKLIVPSLCLETRTLNSWWLHFGLRTGQNV